MKIKSVESIVLEVPIEKPIITSFDTIRVKPLLIVKIQTESGVVGYGECFANYPSWNAKEKAIMIEDGIKPLLMGKDATRPDEIYDFLCDTMLNSGAGRQWGAVGHIMQTLSGINIALYDIAGKWHNKTVFEMLQKEEISEVDGYASGINPIDFEKCVEDNLKKGFDSFKIKVGFGLEKDKNNLKLLRDLIGKKRLFIDVNQGYLNVEDALRQLEVLSKYDFEFVEEPLLARCQNEIAKIRSNGYVVAGGENLYEMHEFDYALSNKTLDICQPDVTKAGGFTALMRIIEQIENKKQIFAPHVFGSCICQVASLNLAFSRKTEFFETDANYNPLLEKLLDKSNFEFKNGKYYKTNTIKGLGIELNQDFINKFRIN